MSEKTNKNAVFRFGIYIRKHALSKDMPDKAQKKGAALTNGALGLWYIHLKIAASGAKRDVISPLSNVPQDIRA